MCSLSVKVLSNYLHLQAHCDKLKAFRIAQFFQNSKIQKITVKKIFFQNFDTGFLLIGVFRVYSRSFIAKLAKTKKSISSEINPIYMSNCGFFVREIQCVWVSGLLGFRGAWFICCTNL